MCYKIDNVDLNEFDTSKVQDMRYVFYNCKNLKNVDLSLFDTSNVIDTSYMFTNCNNLKTIYVSDSFLTNNITSSSHMFSNDSLLVGGNGTPYNNSYTDKTYARIDTSETPGYFTLKSE